MAHTLINKQDYFIGKREPILKMKKEMVIYESIYANEPLCKIDMNKVGEQMDKKVDQAYENVKNNRDFWMKLEKYLAKEQDNDVPNRCNEMKQKKVPQFKNAKEETKGKNGQSDGDKPDDVAQMVRQMSEQAFRSTLKKYGYQMPNQNFFLAEGGYGSVFCVHKDGQRFACKVISNVLFQRIKTERGSALHSSRMRSRFANEVDIMKRVVSHPNIISYVDSFSEEITRKYCPEKMAELEKNELSGLLSQQSETENSPTKKVVFKNFFLLMEFANAKTLSNYVRISRSMPENLVKGIYWSLVDAIKFLHSQQIVHRDIKLSNLLLHRKNVDTVTSGGRRRRSTSFNYDVKLCDFGLSSIINLENETILYVKPVGTSYYFSPELFRAYFYFNRKNDNIVPYCPFKSDIWALAVCIFYCLHGFYPLDILCKPNKHERIGELKKIFEDISENEPLKSIDEQYLNRFRNILRNYHRKLSFNCQELFRRMLEVDAKKRADIFEVAEHTYFKHSM